MSEHFFTPVGSNENGFYSAPLCNGPDYQNKSALVVIYAGQDRVELTVYTASDLKYILSEKQELTTFTPKPGWYELDPEEIIQAIYDCCRRACCELTSLGYVGTDIDAIGITNQREIVVAWNSKTGKSLHKAISVNDFRAQSIAKTIISSLPKHDKNYLRSISGLPVLANFPALKIRWLQDNVDAVKDAINGGYCKVGTLDSWIVWNLTRGALHVTDVTNASYTLLMNINTLQWDNNLLEAFVINNDILPEISCSSKLYGCITDPSCVFLNHRITGIIADQQALLLGQMCFQPGKMSVNLGRNCCILYTIEKEFVNSEGAVTTVANKMDADTSCIYAFDGQVSGCGKLLEWLHQKFRILPDINSAEQFARAVKATNDVFFVPAFDGLDAPYWRKDARGFLVGLSDRTNRVHIVRAALEAICFQINDIIESMRNTGGVQHNVVYASGSHASNELLMQMLADILGAIVVRFNTGDTISYGAAICAGHAIEAVDMKRIKQGIWRNSMDFTTFVPFTKPKQRIQHYTKWRAAVAQSINWANLGAKRNTGHEEKSEAVGNGKRNSIRNGIKNGIRNGIGSDSKAGVTAAVSITSVLMLMNFVQKLN